MRQLELFASPCRWEIPASVCSWREGDRTVWVTVGAHSVDFGWEWWTPGVPVEARAEVGR